MKSRNVLYADEEEVEMKSKVQLDPPRDGNSRR